MARESTQHKLDRVRPPRVHITYDVEIGDAIEMKELPFVVGVLADLSGKPDAPLPRVKDRKFVEIDRDNFNAVLKGMKPRLAFRVDNKLTNDDTKLAVELRFNSMDDFEPEAVANQVEPLRKLMETRRQLAALLAKTDGNDRLSERLQEIISNTELLQQLGKEAGLEAPDGTGRKGGVLMSNEMEQAQTEAAALLQQEESLLERIIDEGRIGRDEEQREQSRKQITTLVEEVMKGTVRVSKDIEATINARIADIDELLSRQLNEIMHAPEFQRLEASWRGLHYLVHQSETSTMLKIRVFNVSKNDLLKDLERASEFDQSALFKKVYEEEYGMFGGAPFGALIGDYEFGRHPQDMALLDQISHVAAAAHAPFIAAASPRLYNLESFTDLGAPRDLAKIFDTVEYVKWKSFRESEDSRYVGLTLPHILLRLPYGPETVPVEAFNFKEDVDGKDHSKYLWGNAAYGFATRLTDAFAKYSWCAAIRGVEGGGLVEGLPTHTFMTDDGEVALKCPTEIAITDRREKELSDLGFIPLVHCKGTDYAAFFGAQSCQKAKKYDTDAANANARLSTQLQYILATSRFAHYLKAIMRDKIGSFMTRQNCQDYLNRWITNYVLLDDNASQAAKAQYPLREARIDVSEVRGKPGVYRAVAFLKPHFQLDELTVSLRLVAELPAPVTK